MVNSKWTFCLRLLKISGVFGLIGFSLLAIQPSYAQINQPASSNEAVMAAPTTDPSTFTYAYEIEDCSGRTANDNYDGSDPVVEDDTNGPNGLPCQSYGLDLYEDLEYGAVGSEKEEEAECADIEYFRVGSDDTWIFIQFDQVSHEDGCGSHQVAIEFDVDATGAMPESLRSDFLYYGATANCAEGTWTDGGAAAGWQGFEDVNNDAGGAEPGTGSTCTLPINKDGNDPLTSGDLGSNKYYANGEDGCSDKYDADESDGDTGDGFESDHKVDGGDQLYCRWDADKFHVAIRRSHMGLSNPASNVRVRGHSDQQSSFDKAKMYDHDANDADFLGSARRDNVDWYTGGNPLAVNLEALQVTLSTADLTIAIVFLLLTAMTAAAWILLRRANQ